MISTLRRVCTTNSISKISTSCGVINTTQRFSSGSDNTSSKKNFITPERSHRNRSGPWDEPNLGSLMNANKAWVHRTQKESPEFFDELKKGHAPKILWIGCVDARVPANEMIGEPPGSVLVHRNIANMVNTLDFNALSAVQFAVDVLRVKHIIVCGHYDCGGVRASLEPTNHKAPLANWLRNIRDIYRTHQAELDAIPDVNDRQRRLVQLNVEEQCLNLFKTGAVQKMRNKTHSLIGQKDEHGADITFAEPRIHGLVYDPTTGIADKLDINFKSIVDPIRHIYDMYPVP